MCVLVAVPALASADPTTPVIDRRAEIRSGSLFSIGVGAGRLGCVTDDGDDCDGDGTIRAGAIIGEAGFMLAPSLAVVGQLSGAMHRDGDYELTQWVAAGALRAWPLRRLWLEAGGGAARIRIEEAGDLELPTESETVPAAVGGIGVEVLSSDKLALDIALRGAAGLYENDLNIYQVTLGVAVTLF